MPHLQNPDKRLGARLMDEAAEAFLNLWQHPPGGMATDAERQAVAAHNADAALRMENPVNAVLDLLESYVATCDDLIRFDNALDGVKDRRADLIALMLELRKRQTRYAFNDLNLT